jgi:DNA-binding NarL/FixJ family response regulator
LGAETVEQAVEMAREIIAPYVKWLDLEGRAQRKAGNGGQWPRLTTEETRVLQALSEGLKGPQIAERLGTTDSTVYVHLHHMREKLGAGNNRQLLEFVREAGLLSVPPVALGNGSVGAHQQAGAKARPDAQ